MSSTTTNNPFYPGIETKSFNGSCHCGQIKWTATLPDLSSPQTIVGTCNCSYCTRSATLNVMIPRSSLRFTVSENEEKPNKEAKADGLDGITTYEFGSKSIAHKSCSKCGVNVFTDQANNKKEIPGVGDMSGFVGVNIRNIEGIDIDKLKLHHFDGRSLKA